MQERIDKLYEVARQTPVLVEFVKNKRMYECLYIYEHEEIPRPVCKNTEIVLYNVPLEKYDKVSWCDINTWTYHVSGEDMDLSNYDENIQQKYMVGLNTLVAPITSDSKKSVKELYELCMYTDVSQPYGIELLHFFNFEFTIDQLRSVEAMHPDTEVILDRIKEIYVDKIRNRRAIAFIELDQLESEVRESGGSQEDIDDIETIKQMFRDIPQDVDLSQYKTITSLISFWPSLLLPNEMHKILWEPHIRILKEYTDENYNEHLTPGQSEFIDILSNVNDTLQLKNLLKLFENDAEIDDIHRLLVTARIDFLEGTNSSNS